MDGDPLEMQKIGNHFEATIRDHPDLSDMNQKEAFRFASIAHRKRSVGELHRFPYITTSATSSRDKMRSGVRPESDCCRMVVQEPVCFMCDLGKRLLRQRDKEKTTEKKLVR